MLSAAKHLDAQLNSVQQDNPVILSVAKDQRSEASQRPAKLLFKRTGPLWLKGQYISDRKMRYFLRRSKNVSFSWEKGVQAST
jgi:hypothetical protein